MSEMVEIPCTATCIIPSCLNVKMYSKLYTVQCTGIQEFGYLRYIKNNLLVTIRRQYFA